MPTRPQPETTVTMGSYQQVPVSIDSLIFHMTSHCFCKNKHESYLHMKTDSVDPFCTSASEKTDIRQYSAPISNSGNPNHQLYAHNYVRCSLIYHWIAPSTISMSVGPWSCFIAPGWDRCTVASNVAFRDPAGCTTVNIISHRHQ